MLEEGHTSENPILKNDHIQSDGDARLDKKESNFSFDLVGCPS